MSKASRPMQMLARHILAIEGNQVGFQSAQAEAAARACEKLRIQLTKVAGPVGYSSLLSRALALAQVDCPELQSVRVGDDGSLQGFPSAESDSVASGHEAQEKASVIVISHLLELLVLFIGEDLMVNLLSDAWPSESWDADGLRTKVKS